MDRDYRKGPRLAPDELAGWADVPAWARGTFVMRDHSWRYIEVYKVVDPACLGELAPTRIVGWMYEKAGQDRRYEITEFEFLEGEQPPPRHLDKPPE